MNLNLIMDIVSGATLLCMAIVIVFATYMYIDMIVVYLKNFKKNNFNDK